ncbi:MAG: hypothetical protein HY513_05405, partial [Candidatus Aenigmarchaeota archaeon]|nr:hypothetical protein [Candidatus Aenigmarchaeota archaeon]
KGRWKGVIYYKLKISSINNDIIEKIETLLNSFDVTYYKSIQKGGFLNSKEGIRIEISNQALVAIFKNLGIASGAKSYTVDTGKANTFSNELIAAYIGGLFDGDGSFDLKHNSLRLSSRSRKLIENTRILLLRLGLHCISYEENKSYTLAINRKRDVLRFLAIVPSVRFKQKSLNYIKNTRPIKSFGDIAFEKVERIDKIKLEEPIPVYNLSVENTENYICNGFITHNCGRAGRPKYDTEGRAIIIAKSKREAKELKEMYIHGEPEPIYSKLSVEPVLRMHTLALIASETTKTKNQLRDFFSRTFFAHQYGKIQDVMKKVEKILKELESFKFIKIGDKDTNFITSDFIPAFDIDKDIPLKATLLGKKISDLYIDPLSAAFIINNISAAASLEQLMVIVRCGEIPKLNVRKAETDEIEDRLTKSGLVAPDVWDVDYYDFLCAFKTALIFQEWIEEKTEDYILDKYGVAPGELYTKITSGEWMLYAGRELALVLRKKEEANGWNKTRLRVKEGVREELLKLTVLKGVGRARARKLYNAGIETYSDIKNVGEQDIGKIVGPKVAKQILEEANKERLIKYS